MISQRAANPRHTFSTRPCLSISFHILAFALFLCAFPVETFAQSDTPPDSSDEVVRVSTDLVTVPVFVNDARGRRVSGLTRNDFEVRDEGHAVETSYFAAGAEHVALLFLLDASGSTRDIIARQRETALALFSRFGSRSRVAVMQFDDRQELTLPFTSDAARANAAFHIAAAPNRRTAIFDAALAAARAFKSGDQLPAERRIVILISDGLDTASAAHASAAINEARESNVTFYVIHLPLYTPREGRLVPRRASRGFRELAEKTGGQFFVVGDARSSLDPRAEYDLQSVFRAIAEDLSGQYVLGYYSEQARRDKQPHRIEVRLTATDRRNLRVRPLRVGYTLKQ
ncbi:MAG: VWA domain-containing protein [Acidobacteria bacterium]|nr:VWA domain-containing protein [Acidobacteriota bacterium]